MTRPTASPRDAVTGRVIAGLRITLVDSLGKSVGTSEEDYLFSDASSGVIQGEGSRGNQQIYNDLWFARGAYVLVSGYTRKRLQIRIEDVDRRSDGVYYDPVTLPISRDDLHELCISISDWDEGAQSRFAQKFHPVAVTLVRRDVQ